MCVLLELIHAAHVLRAWTDDPNRHVCDVSLFSSQRHERRPYSQAEIDRLKELVRHHALTDYLQIFYREGDLYYRFTGTEPQHLTPVLLQTPDSVDQN